MKKRDITLTGFLLILIGVMIGILITMLQPDQWGNDFAEVKVTEITRSSQPLFSQEELQQIDTRFLFQEIAREVTPTVVYVETTVNVRGGSRMEEEEDENGIWERFLPRRARTVGSGVIISTDGYILTNHHVIQEAVSEGIMITMSDKRTYPARVVGSDPSTDLAVLKVDEGDLPTAVIGNSDYLDVGEWVLAIGNPFRLQSTVTAGIVSALSRDVRIIDDAMSIESFIQTDAAINRGNSGGALVNTSGELIGINTAIATQSGNYQGYGFAVPSNLALKVAGDLIEYGEARRGLMGVRIESVNHAIARDMKMERIRGVLIVRVEEDEAAWQAGMQDNDVVLEINGQEVNEANQLQEKVALYRPGDVIRVTVLRNGETLVKEVTLKERPQRDIEVLDFEEDEVQPEEFFERRDRERDPNRDRERNRDREPDDPDVQQQSFNHGFTLRAIPGLPDNDSYEILVHSVDRQTEAWNRGLRSGFRVLEVDDQPVLSMQEFEDRFREGLESNGYVSLKTQTTNDVIAHIVLNR